MPDKTESNEGNKMMGWIYSGQEGRVPFVVREMTEDTMMQRHNHRKQWAQGLEQEAARKLIDCKSRFFLHLFLG